MDLDESQFPIMFRIHFYILPLFPRTETDCSREPSA